MKNSLSHPFIDCGGASITVQPGDVATVLMLCGEIDAANVDCVVRELRTYVGSEHPVVLDVSELGFLSVGAFRGLVTLDEERRNAGTHWVIVHGAAMSPYLRVAPDHPLPLVRSGVDALQRFGPVVHSAGPVPPVVAHGAVRC